MSPRPRNTWFTSSHSSDNAACVEVRISEDAVDVRDTRDRGGPVLSFGHAAWTRFLSSLDGDEEALVPFGTFRWALLYRTPEGWRISVASGAPEFIACGALSDTPADAPVEVAQRELLDHLHHYFAFTDDLTWKKDARRESWSAEPATSPATRSDPGAET